MAIIMPDGPRQKEEKRESILELLGRGFASGAGQSLGTGLGQLATQGLGSLMDPNQRPLDAKTLEALGLDPNQAKAIASIRNPAVQRDIINATQTRQMEAKEKERKRSLARGYGQAHKNLTGQDLTAQIYGQQQQQPGEIPQQGEMTQQPQAQTPLQEQDLDEVANDLMSMKELGKIAQKEQHATKEEKYRGHKDTEKGHDIRKSSWDLSHELDIGINKMDALDKTQNLDSPAYATFLKKIGMEQLLSPESALFNKIRAAYMAGAPKAVGGKVSNFELMAHMERFPSLMISKEGRQLIYDDIRMMNELAREAYEIEREIVRKNGGYRPHDIDYQIDDKMGDIFKKFSKRFVDNIEKAKKLVPGNEKQVHEGLPDATGNKGRKIKGAEGILVSNGTQWVPESTTQSQPPNPTMQTQSLKGSMSPVARRGLQNLYR